MKDPWYFPTRFIKPLTCIFLALGISLIFILLSDTELLESLELKSLDYRFKLRGKIKVSEKVVVVNIDDQTVKGFNWPLSSKFYAGLIEILRQNGAKVIGFDILFSHPDPIDPQNDQLLTYMTKSSGNLCYSMGFIVGEEGLRNISPLPQYLLTTPIQSKMAENFSYPVPSDSNISFIQARDAILPLPELLKSAFSLGHINTIPDSDGIIRKVPLMIEYNKKLYPLLSLQMVCDYLSIPKEKVRIKNDKLWIGDCKIPINQNGEMIINYTSNPEEFKLYSFLDVCNLVKSQEITLHFKDKIVLVGVTATGIGDLGAIPGIPTYPMIMIHSQIISNILEKEFLKRAPEWINKCIIIILGAFLGFLFTFLSPLYSFLLVLIIYITFSWVLFKYAGIWIDMVSPTLVIPFSFGTILVYQYLMKQKETIGYLVRMQELEKENRLKAQAASIGTLTSIVRHEIGNSMGGIKNLALSIRSSLSEKNFSKQRECLDEIIMESEKSLARLRTQNSYIRPLELISVDINDFLAKTLMEVESSAKKTKVKIKTNWATNLPLIKIDIWLMREALLNIILNAIQSMPGGGELVTTTRFINHNYVEIKIKDEGIGIHGSIRDKIFDPFVTTKQDGTGWGLPIAQRNIASHSGQIRFEDNEKKGTTFIITLPLGN